MVHSLPGRMGSGSTHTVVAGRQIDHNQALADLVRANQPVGTWIVVVDMAYAAVHRLPNTSISVTGTKKNPGRETIHSLLRARLSSIMRSKIVRALTKLSFIDMRSAKKEDVSSAMCPCRLPMLVHTALLTVFIDQLDDLRAEGHA
jgi:hypothetical protein